MKECRLYDIAKVIRSKNSGPFQITLDVLFENKRDYEQVKRQGIISRERIAGIYKLSEDEITELVYFDQACGIKVTFNRRISSGTCGDRDVYGAQQHAPLMAIALEEEEV